MSRYWLRFEFGVDVLKGAIELNQIQNWFNIETLNSSIKYQSIVSLPFCIRDRVFLLLMLLLLLPLQLLLMLLLLLLPKIVAKRCQFKPYIESGCIDIKSNIQNYNNKKRRRGKKSDTDQLRGSEVIRSHSLRF